MKKGDLVINKNNGCMGVVIKKYLNKAYVNFDNIPMPKCYNDMTTQDLIIWKNKNIHNAIEMDIFDLKGVKR